MERMLVVVFDNEKKAFEGRSALRQLEVEGSISIYAGAVVVKHADGTVSVKQLDDGPIGTLTGTAVGSLIGLLGWTGGAGHRRRIGPYDRRGLRRRHPPRRRGFRE